MRPGPTDPWTKRSELFVRRWVVRAFGALVHRRRPAPDPGELSAARVLLIRQDRIGDVLVSTPLIVALQQALPGLTFDMLVSTNNQVALAGVPAIRRGWVYERSFASMVRLLRSIRREQYDVAVDLMDNPSATATAFCVLSGARWTVGLAKENDYSYDVRIPLMSRRDRHIIERLAPIAETFGVSAANATGPVVYLPKTSSRAAAREMYESLQCLARRKLGVNISAGSERRFWGTDRFRAFIQYLHMTDPSATIIILSKPSDHERACE
ncbi:MAG: glycosyltransferase family 9 protein, partial [Bacteroidota bacterium]